MGLWESFRRWKACRGYGVHSPLGFRLVKHVIRPSREVIYYGEEKIDCAREDYYKIKRARVLLRFVAEMQPATVWTSAKMPQIYIDAIRYAGCVIRIYEGGIFPEEAGKSDMTVLDGSKLKKNELTRALESGKSFIGFNLKPSFIRSIIDTVKGGVILEGKRSMIVVSTSDPQLHVYSILPF